VLLTDGRGVMPNLGEGRGKYQDNIVNSKTSGGGKGGVYIRKGTRQEKKEHVWADRLGLRGRKERPEK